jgi:hypothetical protein
MVTYLTIKSDCSQFKLTALYKNGEYYMPSFQYDENEDSWDNPNYLIQLSKYFNDIPTDVTIDDENLVEMFLNQKHILKELFNEATQLGFFKNKL